MKGVLNLYKPKGITSSDAVVKCRRILGTKAIGHMGTLDPAGEGVLLLGVGKATRLFDYYLKKDKVYEAEFCFGYETDTLDGEGQIIACADTVPVLSDIEKVLPQFIGKQKQIPPRYSAKSVNGVRSYKLAREGKAPDLPACDVEIYALDCVRQTGENTWLFRVHCSAGTYIRSLCRDVAARLGALATMVSIKRTRCGAFTAENAVTLEELTERGEHALTPVCAALADLPEYRLPDEYYTKLRNGIGIALTQDCTGDFALYCKNELFGIGCAENGRIKIKTYLRD
ncbi:MAG: tRNA pseudouridine(55) synthase TruB [Clostridia bacterium]|nr:tRNA pseudouridine(55) synthase TruB [Clostridia bacterium]